MVEESENDNEESTSSLGSVIEADSLSDSDEGYAASTTTSYVTSIASDIRRGIEENGRTYPVYGKNEYGLPIDDREQDRNDLQHCKFTLLLGEKLFLAPITEKPQKILDLGTGTGIWAIDMADKYPSAEVIGTDLIPIQPNWVPANCIFEVDDAEDDWLYPSNSFDFIHGRDFLLAIRNWPRLIAQAYDALKPGAYLELSCTHPVPQSSDGTHLLLPNYNLITSYYFAIGTAIGADGHSPLNYATWMREAGFVDVTTVTKKIPSSPWPKDPILKKVGAFEYHNMLEGAEAFILRGMVEVMGRRREEVEIVLMGMREELKKTGRHGFIEFITAYGRKPENAI